MQNLIFIKAVPYGVQMQMQNAPRSLILHNYLHKNVFRSLSFANNFHE